MNQQLDLFAADETTPEPPRRAEKAQDAPKQQDRCIDTLTPAEALTASTETWAASLAYLFSLGHS